MHTDSKPLKMFTVTLLRNSNLTSLITDRIRSMGEGNVFTGDCLSTGRGGGGVCLLGAGLLSEGVYLLKRRGLHGRGGGSAWRSTMAEIRRDMVNQRSVRIPVECILVFR